MLVSIRSSFGEGHSPSASRATMICATISAAERLRTSRCVPVWQKLQVNVQPTWDETHSVPRSASGMWTVSTSCPSAKRSSHFRVPSCETRARLRSEEHTSELQSRRDLVCRLLLEKKKN